MRPTVLLDTGPLVAFLSKRGAHHGWATDQFSGLRLPFHTCDAVIAEATHILGREGLPREHVLDLIERRAVIVDLDPNEEAEAVANLLARYANVPMDYADACLVRIAERFPTARVLTVDSDSYVYRRDRTEPILLVAP